MWVVKRLRHIFLALMLLLPSVAEAQFYVTGDDPGGLKWDYIDTDSYRIIYPRQSDSLAMIYASELEKYKIPVSRTTGYVTGDGDGKLMPVVMHAYNTSNGSVAWAPKRMDLFTIPSAYNPEPMPWTTMLAVHESRHITQMQFGMTGTMKPFNYVFGEMFNILVSLVYPEMYLIEGDAVVAETALTHSGRGRTADFLNYYMVAFDQGDLRSFPRWLYGSQRYYAPNHYALGYMTLGGIRYIYDYPNIMDEAYHKSARNIFYIPPARKLAKKAGGVKKFSDVFSQVRDTMKGIWSAEIEKRAPFIVGEAVTAEPGLYTSYKDNIASGSDIYSIKSGFMTAPVLVRIDSSGGEDKISRFASQSSVIRPTSQGRIYWSENLPDARWSMKFDSRIRYIDPSRSARKKNLTDRKELLFNPSPSEDGFMVATVQYYPEGGSSLTVRKTYEGGTSQTWHAPDSVQLLETAWIGNDIYVTGLSDGGYGIYHLPGAASGTAEEWQTVLAPQPVMIKDFNSYRGELIFACDRTGVHELYHLDPESKVLRQKTSTRYGSSDFTYSTDGKWLYYSSQTLDGMKMFRTSVDSLINRTVDYRDIHKYVIADRLAEQEKEIARQAGFDKAVPEVDFEASEPRRYSKAGHMFNLHSWAPVYVSVDNIMNMSFDKIWQAASLGVSGIMQNRLATGVGEFGYSAHKDPYNPAKWRHSGHAKFTYSGLYPVIEASVDFNDRAARQYNVTGYAQDGRMSVSLGSKELPSPYIEGNLSVYIPFNFSSGGWYKGVIPKVSYRISNDMFNTSMAVMSSDGHIFTDNRLISFKDVFYLIDASVLPSFIGATKGKNSFRHSLSGSIRAYTMLGTPNSAVYPKWGIGLEAGASGSLESSQFLSPMGYAYGYGYVPGFTRTQGLKLTAMAQTKLSGNAIFGQPVVNILPRGLSENAALLQWLSIRNDLLTRFTADYAVPIYIGDAHIGGGLFYIKRLVLTPHFDYMPAGGWNLYSAGCDLTFDLNSILWLGWPCSVGVTYSYNGSPRFNDLQQASGINIGHHFVGPTFNVSF